MGKNIRVKTYSVPRIAVSNWVNLLEFLSLFFYLPISHTWMCFIFFLCLLFLKKTYCLFHISARTHRDNAIQDCKCHVQEKGISQLDAWSHNQTSWERWGRGVPLQTVAARGHCQRAPTGSLTSEAQVSWNQEEFGTGLDVKLRLLLSNWHHCRQRGNCSWVTWQLVLMHNTCVHSFVYFAGIFRKPYNIPQTENLNCFQVKNITEHLQVDKAERMLTLSLLRAIFTLPTLLLPLFFALPSLKFHGLPLPSTQKE